MIDSRLEKIHVWLFVVHTQGKLNDIPSYDR